MTLAYIYDRTRPLAERVQDAIDAIICERDWGNTTEAEEAALSEVIADIAAADRLARAASAWSFTRDAALDRLYAAPDPIRGTVAGGGEADSEAAYREYEDAMDAYRARMAQGVGRG